jgi:putative oxidoreductase
MNNKRVDVALLILRLGVGPIACFYGAQKLFGAFHGSGYHGTIGFMDHMGIPPVLAILAMCAEFFGGLGIFLGCLTGLAAFGFACTMAVATYFNWTRPGLVQTVFTSPGPNDPPQLFFSLVLFVAAVAIMVMGGGTYSLDRLIFSRKARKGPRVK